MRRPRARSSSRGSTWVAARSRPCSSTAGRFAWATLWSQGMRTVPGDPVEILGFDKPPAAGELARVVANDREARDLANRRGERLRREQLASVRPGGSVSLEGLYEALQAGDV